ncbi:UNVERIFIED_CONTAM: site-specific DNA-methyltransferase [Microbacterium sp. SLM126]
MNDVAVASESAYDSEGDGIWTVHQGDARDLAALLSRASRVAGEPGSPFLKTTITSPPYATLVDYGSENQIGFGQSYDEYLESCRAIFEELLRWTVGSGSMWVVADTLLQRRSAGEPSKLVPLPFELAAQAEAVGWTLREVVVWRKDRTRPWSHHGKLRNGFEYVLFFVKSNNYTFNVDRLRDTGNLKSWWVKYPERHNPWGMAPDNVWDIPIPVQGSWDGSAFRHACPFPAELVRRMVLLSSDEDDVVFDPFAGSGAVVTGAIHEGRRGLGIELNHDYVQLFRQSNPSRRADHDDAKPISAMTQRLLELRALKYPKDLANQIVRAGFTTSQIRAVLMLVESINFEPARSGYGRIACVVVVADELSELENARLAKVVGDVRGVPPLSKYGLDASIEILTIEEATQRVSDDEVSIYKRGRTWSASEIIVGHHLDAWLRNSGTPSVIPIVSPLHVRQSLEESN